MANGTLAVVRKMFNWAVSRDLLDVSPCNGVTPPAKPRSRDRVLSPAEIQTFWHDLDKAEMSDEVAAALRLQLITAQRIGEIVSLQENAGRDFFEVRVESRKLLVPAVKDWLLELDLENGRIVMALPDGLLEA